MTITQQDIDDASIDPGTKPLLSDMLARIVELESAPPGTAQTFPDSVVENYPDGTAITYNKA